MLYKTTASCWEAKDCGLLPSFQFVDVVMLWAVAMVSVLPISFEFPGLTLALAGHTRLFTEP